MLQLKLNIIVFSSGLTFFLLIKFMEQKDILKRVQKQIMIHIKIPKCLESLFHVLVIYRKMSFFRLKYLKMISEERKILGYMYLTYFIRNFFRALKM